MVALFEIRGVGIQWHNLSDQVIYTELTFDWMLGFLVIDGVIYGLIGWYVSNVFPGMLFKMYKCTCKYILIGTSYGFVFIFL